MGRLIIPEMKKRMIIKLYLFTLPESGNTVGGNYKQFRLTALPSRTSLLNTQPVMWFSKHLEAHTSAQQTMQNVGFVIFLEVLANKTEVDIPHPHFENIKMLICNQQMHPRKLSFLSWNLNIGWKISLLSEIKSWLFFSPPLLYYKQLLFI